MDLAIHDSDALVIAIVTGVGNAYAIWRYMKVLGVPNPYRLIIAGIAALALHPVYGLFAPVHDQPKLRLWPNE